MSPVSQEPPLTRLFAIGYRANIEGLHDELARRGWDDVRPAYGFALLAVRDSPATVTDLARWLGMTKQAASVLVEQLAGADLVRRNQDPADRRAWLVSLTRRGRRLLSTVEEIYAEQERRAAELIGAERLARLRADLVTLLSDEDGGLLPLRPVW